MTTLDIFVEVKLDEYTSWQFDASKVEDLFGPPVGIFRPKQIRWDTKSVMVLMYCSRVYESGRQSRANHVFSYPVKALPGYVQDWFDEFTDRALLSHEFSLDGAGKCTSCKFPMSHPIHQEFGKANRQAVRQQLKEIEDDRQ